MILLLWVVLAYVAMSIAEYVAHRWPMHSAALARRFPILADEHEAHVVLHHGRYYGRVFQNAQDRAARYISIELNPVFMVTALSPVWVTLWFFSRPGGLTFAAFFALHGIVHTAVHREIHEPRNPWFARLWLFDFYSRYHRVHHMRTTRNFNLICPGADWLFGTLEKEVCQ